MEIIFYKFIIYFNINLFYYVFLAFFIYILIFFENKMIEHTNLTDHFMKHRLMTIRNSDLKHDGGYCWTLDLPASIPCGEVEGQEHKSPLRLFENGLELGPASSFHEAIRKWGCGRFSHWESRLYLSSSDHVVPAKSRNLYQIMIPDPALHYPKLDETEKNTPVNLRRATYNATNVLEDARHAMMVAEGYLAALPEGRASLQGKSVLELGPGPSFGTVLILRALGAASAHVADRFLAQFHAEYHPPLYRLLAQMVREKYPDADLTPLLDAAQKGHEQSIVQTSDRPLEDLASVFQNIDITLSRSVFEHLYDQFQAIRVLHDVTASGGLGLHEVDFRDHRDFSKPLEYLFMGDHAFAQLFEAVHCECGDRTRPFQMERMFRVAGFTQVAFEADMFTEPAYLDDVIERLRLCPTNLYGYMQRDQLMPILGRFLVVK